MAEVRAISKDAELLTLKEEVARERLALLDRERSLFETGEQAPPKAGPDAADEMAPREHYSVPCKKDPTTGK